MPAAEAAAGDSGAVEEAAAAGEAPPAEPPVPAPTAGPTAGTPAQGQRPTALQVRTPPFKGYVDEDGILVATEPTLNINCD